MADKPETDSFLALLDAKITTLQTLRDAYVKALSLGALGQPGEGVSVVDSISASMTSAAATSYELPTGAFLGMSIPEAIKLFLSAVRKKQTVREIGNALKEGGIETTATNWETTVTGALHRLKAAGAVLRFKDGWALAEFYPESLRNRLAKDEKPRKTRKARKAKPEKAKATDAPIRGIRLRTDTDVTEKAS